MKESMWLITFLILVSMSWLLVVSKLSSIARGLSVVLVLLTLPTLGYTILTTLGHPIHSKYSILLSYDRGEILGYKLVEGTGIYLLLDVGEEPVYFVVPWDADRAQALQDTVYEARKRNSRAYWSFEGDEQWTTTGNPEKVIEDLEEERKEVPNEYPTLSPDGSIQYPEEGIPSWADEGYPGV